MALHRASSLLSPFAGLPARRISRALGAGGAALLLVWALQPGAWAHNDRIVTTPSGERVRVYHVTLHTAVERDFHEYLDSRGRRVRHGLSKIYYVNGVKHKIDGAGYRTSFDVEENSA